MRHAAAEAVEIEPELEHRAQHQPGRPVQGELAGRRLREDAAADEMAQHALQRRGVTLRRCREIVDLGDPAAM